MSRPRYRWWGYVKAVIRAYPELKARYNALHSPSVTAGYGNPAPGAGPGDPTGRTALRELPRQEQRELEAVQKAIEKTAALPAGRERLLVIDLVLLKKSHTLDGAAMQVPCSWRTAAQYHGEFIHLVAKHLELEDCIPEPKNRDIMASWQSGRTPSDC